MSQRLFLLFQDSKIVPKKKAFECIFYEDPPNILGIWIIASLAVILIGFFFVKAINHKEAKTDWEKFFLYYGVLCVISLIIYVLLHD